MKPKELIQITLICIAWIGLHVLITNPVYAQSTGDWSTDYAEETSPDDTDVFQLQKSPFAAGVDRWVDWDNMRLGMFTLVDDPISFADNASLGVRHRSLTTAERDATSPAAGDVIWNETDTELQYYNGSAWAAVGAGGGDALTTDPLSQFAATTSVQLGGVISDETGVGSAVFAIGAELDNVTLDGTTLTGSIASATDIDLVLGDAAGVNKLSIQNSALAEVASVNSNGNMTVNDLNSDTLIFTEKAASTTVAATFGEFWLNNSALQLPKFTDDTDTDYNIAVTAGEGTSGQVLTSNGAGVRPTYQDAAGGSPTDNAIAALDIAWTANDTYHKSIGATNSTFTFSGDDNGETIIVTITSTTGTVTWPGTVAWQGGGTPTQTSNGTDTYTFYKSNGTVYGAHTPESAVTAGAYGSIYWSSPAATSNVAATPIKAAGTTAAQGTANQFTQATTNRLTYTGSETIEFKASAYISVSASAATLGSYFIAKNGTEVVETEVQRQIPNTDIGAMAVSGIVTLSQNDYIELWCETDDGDDLTVEFGTLTVTSLANSGGGGGSGGAKMTLQFNSNIRSPALTETRYVGSKFHQVPDTAEADVQIPITISGNITAWYLHLSSTPGTAETFTCRLFINGAASAATAISTVQYDQAREIFSITGISVAVSAGDTVSMEYTMPGSGTPATNISFSGSILVEE